MDLFNCFARLLRDDSGATAIEYGLIAALIAVGAALGGARRVSRQDRLDRAGCVPIKAILPGHDLGKRAALVGQPVFSLRR
jgi:hypothetical protein